MLHKRNLLIVQCSSELFRTSNSRSVCGILVFLTFLRVASVSNLLRDIESALSQQELHEWQNAALKPILTEFHNALNALGKIVDQNSCLHSSVTHRLSEKTRRVWKRLTWDTKDVQQLHSRLGMYLGLLNAFNRSLNRCD
jgi:hypothetical protein